MLLLFLVDVSQSKALLGLEGCVFLACNMSRQIQLALSTAQSMLPHTHNLAAADAVQGPQKRSVDDDNNSTWEALCTLTLWLSQLVLIPFDLAIVDSQLTDASGR